MSDYVKQRESLLGGGAGVKAPLGGAVAPACSAPGGAGAAAAPAADAGGGAGGGTPEVESGEGVDEKWKGSTKLSVYRTEKKNGEGELVQEKGRRVLDSSCTLPNTSRKGEPLENT